MDSTAEARMTSAPAFSTLRFHHVGVQTADLTNSLAWYGDFFGCEPTWTATRFSLLTLSRLPGIGSLVELMVGAVRFHLFDRGDAGPARPAPEAQQYQHVCLQVASPEEVHAWRERWLTLYLSGRYTFTVEEPPTDVVIDDDGIQSFYCRDVNGLELEFTYTPAAAS